MNRNRVQQVQLNPTKDMCGNTKACVCMDNIRNKEQDNPKICFLVSH